MDVRRSGTILWQLYEESGGAIKLAVVDEGNERIEGTEGKGQTVELGNEPINDWGFVDSGDCLTFGFLRCMQQAVEIVQIKANELSRSRLGVTNEVQTLLMISTDSFLVAGDGVFSYSVELGFIKHFEVPAKGILSLAQLPNGDMLATTSNGRAVQFTVDGEVTNDSQVTKGPLLLSSPGVW